MYVINQTDYYGGTPPDNVTTANSMSLFASLIMAMFSNLPICYPPAPKKSYDFVVVGSGAAGSVIANRLSEVSDWNILLLEAGGDAPDVSKVPGFYYYSFGSPLDWGYSTKSQPEACSGKPCKFPSGKVLGGSTVINTMVYNRGNRHIFDNWEHMGNDGWSYEEILPYFKKSEKNMDPQFANDTEYHSVHGYQCVQQFPYQDANTKMILKALDEAGYPEVDVNGATQYGYMLQQSYTHDGERRSAYMSFIESVKNKRHNLDIMPHAFVTKILIDPNTKKAYGVEYLDNENKTVLVNASKEVIISAGVFNSPKLLQLSGVGPKELLEKFGIEVIADLAVGKNLIDHISGGFSLILNDTEIIPNNLGDLVSTYASYIKTKNGPLSAIGVDQLIIYTNSKLNDRPEVPDIQFIITNKVSSEVYWKLPNSYYNTIVISVTNVNTLSRGSVQINSTDPFSPPIIDFNFLSEYKDLERLADGVKVAVNLTKTESLNKLDSSLCLDKRCKSLTCGSDDHLKCIINGTIIPGFHGTGTCKMGAETDKSAVVSPKLKVHGISGLRVADASIMPQQVNSNTEAPTMMIGEKASDLIKSEWLISKQN